MVSDFGKPAPSFFYLSTNISTHPQWILPIEMMGGWDSVRKAVSKSWETHSTLKA